jgi:hypothetical protein
MGTIGKAACTHAHGVALRVAATIVHAATFRAMVIVPSAETVDLNISLPPLIIGALAPYNAESLSRSSALTP